MTTLAAALLCCAPGLAHAWPIDHLTSFSLEDSDNSNAHLLEAHVHPIADALTALILESQKQTTLQKKQSVYRHARIEQEGGAIKIEALQKRIHDMLQHHHYINSWTKHSESWTNVEKSGNLGRAAIAALVGAVATFLAADLYFHATSQEIEQAIIIEISTVGLIKTVGLVGAITGLHSKIAVKKSQKLLMKAFFNRLKENGVAVPRFGRENWLNKTLAELASLNGLTTPPAQIPALPTTAVQTCADTLVAAAEDETQAELETTVELKASTRPKIP